MSSSDGVQPVLQYSTSIESITPVPSLSDGVGRKDAAGCGLSNNNNTSTFLDTTTKPELLFESYPETGSQGIENDAQGRSGDVNNPLSLTPAVTTAGSLPEVTRSELINNNNNHIPSKITENHLSVKNHRANIAPYFPTKARSSPSQTDASAPPRDAVTVEEMYDSVMVSNAHVNNSSSGQSPLLGGVLLPSNSHINQSKLEPNGNNIEIQLIGSQEQQQQGQHLEGDLMMMHGGNPTERHNIPYSTSGSESVIMGLLHGNNSSSILSSSSLGPGGGGALLVMSHGNGVSLTSPGGSLEDQDCDEEKVINGDTFSPGDVPDPDAIKMFVGQIPKHLSESELKTLFEEFGRVFQINVLRDKVSKQSKGCCFVTFYTRKAALDAQNALHNVKTLSGMNHPIQMKPADNENRYERKLFVGMLSKKCNESDVRNMFSRFGHIDECTVLRDPQGTSRGCAFITFASKQCAQSAIKALHHSLTMEGCSSPVVVKFADTQKDKDQKRNQQIHATILPGFQSPPSTANALGPQYFSLLQQLQQQQQSSSYFSSLSPLSVATLASLASPSPGASLAGLTGSPNPGTNSDLAALAALANYTGVGVSSNQHPLTLGLQAAIAAAINGGHSALSQDFSYSGANGSSLGSSSSLASSFPGNGLHSSGLSSYTSAIRPSAANKQAEGPEGANLFIYHLPPEATDPDLISMFSPFGTVISAKVYIDKNTNRSKCFGFVSYDNAMSAQVAIQTMNGFQVGMKRLKVQLKRSKEAAKPY